MILNLIHCNILFKEYKMKKKNTLISTKMIIVVNYQHSHANYPQYYIIYMYIFILLFKTLIELVSQINRALT